MRTHWFRTRRAGLALPLVAVLAGAGLVAAPADSTPGVNDYPRALKSASRDALVDPWLFFNRECTSWTAWRLNHDNWGLPYGSTYRFSNFYKGQHWGNANHWATAARAAGIRVNSTPAVGSVAYWMSGYFGHVAWVRKVTRTTVTIEEYNYLVYGGYGTRTLTKGASNYPTGFIHIHDLGNTRPPSISGTAQVGVPLTAGKGRWVLPGATYAYQWRADGVAIPGATATTYVPSPTRVGERISVRVTGRKPGVKRIRATTAATSAVVPGRMSITTPPAVSGTAKVGATLTASPGRWSPARASYSYQWQADGADIPGATTTTYVPTGHRVDQKISVRVTARKNGYVRRTAESAAVGPLRPGTIVNRTAPAVLGSPQVGVRLSASPGTWSVAGVRYHYQWLAAGKPVRRGHAATFVPRARQFGKRLEVAVRASALGYNDKVVTSRRSAAVAPGIIEVGSGPSVRGSAVVGHRLRAVTGQLSTRHVTVSRHWLRDGHRIRGERAATYIPTRADIGHRLSVRLTLTRHGFVKRAENSPETAPVRIRPRLVVRDRVTSRHVRLHIRVRARGAPPATGRVRVYVGKHLVRRPLLSDAVAVVKLRGLHHGWRTFHVRYGGDQTHTRRSLTIRIRVPR